MYGILIAFILQKHTTMNKTLTAVCGLGMATMLFSSCLVSKKKYDEATARANKEHADNEALNARVNRQSDSLYHQAKTIAQLNSTIDGLNARIARLKDSIAQNETAIAHLNDKIGALGNENQDAARQLNSTKAQMAAQRKRLEQLQAFIDQQQKATEALRKKIADALTGFNSSELTVNMKNGRVYISMQESLLFPSGSAVVNPKGKDALSKVAGVLNTSTDINIEIEGHTDSLPIHTKQYADNWSLSTARATSIAHVLIDEYRVNPAKLVASGRSEYDPIATNATPEGRAQNRRTEIILEPKLDELMQLMSGGK